MKYGEPASFSAELSVCQNCRRCVECCPADISIPDMLQIYRQYQAVGLSALAPLNAEDFSAYPIDCIECGVCSDLCPKCFDPAGVIRRLAMTGYK